MLSAKCGHFIQAFMCSGNGLVPNKQQAMTCTNVDQDMCLVPNGITGPQWVKEFNHNECLIDKFPILIKHFYYHFHCLHDGLELKYTKRFGIKGIFYYIGQKNEITCVLFYQHGLTLIPAWISNYIHYKVWYGIVYPFQNINGTAIQVWEWISNFIPHFTGHVVTYPCQDWI